jgi:hypothetical protein
MVRVSYRPLQNVVSLYWRSVVRVTGVRTASLTTSTQATLGHRMTYVSPNNCEPDDARSASKQRVGVEFHLRWPLRPLSDSASVITASLVAASEAALCALWFNIGLRGTVRP